MKQIQQDDPNPYSDLSSCIYGFFWMFVVAAALISGLWYSFFPDLGYSEIEGVGTVWLHETSLDRWMQLRFWELLALFFFAGLIVAGCLKRWRIWQIGLLVVAIVAIWVRWWYAM